MSELFDFGKYAPYIAATYGASVIVIGALIFQRRARLQKVRELERRKAEAE